jgi:hypothetical protein
MSLRDTWNRLAGKGDGTRQRAEAVVEAHTDNLKAAVAKLEEVLGPREKTMALALAEQRAATGGSRKK